jgi:hypothetical protein
MGLDWLKYHVFTGKIPRLTPLNNEHLNNEGQEC